MSAENTQPLGPALRRALCLHCPNCGKGNLFISYLKPVAQCAACGEVFGHIQAEDGPAWLSILIIGHIIVPLLIVVQINTAWPPWLMMIVFGGLTTALVFALLPVTKAFFITMIWRARIQKP